MPIHQEIIDFSATTLLGGTVSVAFKVPGTFGGIPPADPTMQRYFVEARVWPVSFQDGDAVDSVQIVDTDGVIPSAARAALPNYPVVLDFASDAPSGAAGGQFFQSGTPLVIKTYNDTPEPVPSGLYVTFRFVSGGLALGKTFRGNLTWGKYSAV